MEKTAGSIKPLFKSKLLEAFTYSNILIHLIWYIGLSVISCVVGVKLGATNFIEFCTYFIAGILTWSFVEYIMHRYLFHMISDVGIVVRLKYIFHGIHHEFPREEKRTLMPPIPGLIIYGLYFFLFYFLMGNKGAILSGGFLIGYTFYSCLHFAIHIYRAPKMLLPLWTHHLLHHYQQPNKAFGVSSRIWDRVFGTMPIVKIKKKSQTC